MRCELDHPDISLAALKLIGEWRGYQKIAVSQPPATNLTIVKVLDARKK